jgi:hypothetical protein
MKTALFLMLALVTTMVLTEPLPVPKPRGYLAFGSYCVPGQGASDAIAKPPNGTCPWGWLVSGNYCLRSGSR